MTFVESSVDGSDTVESILGLGALSLIVYCWRPGSGTGCGSGPVKSTTGTLGPLVEEIALSMGGLFALVFLTLGFDNLTSSSLRPSDLEG